MPHMHGTKTHSYEQLRLTDELADKQLNSFAENCRPQIKSFIDTKKSNKTSLSWREDYKNRIFGAILLATKGHKNIFEEALRQILEKYPHETLEIKKAVKKSLRDGVLRAEAYKWLKYLNNPGVAEDYAWYPRHAVKVAHRAFRLTGNLKTFTTYLSHPSRKLKLKSIPLPDICVSIHLLQQMCRTY